MAEPVTAEQLRFEDWTGDRSVVAVGTNAGCDPLPFQTWRRIKEAFAPEIVERAVAETPGPVEHVADPFGGSGTTALAAQFLGIKPTTIEVNPFLADLIEAKLATLDLDLAYAAFDRVVQEVGCSRERKRPQFTGAPATFVEPGRDERFIFSRAVARRILSYRAAVDRVADEGCRRLFRVVLASTTVPVSNVVVSGKGRRYRGGWQKRVGDPNLVDELFRSGVLQALDDLREYAARPCLDYSLLRGDARIRAGEIGRHDLAVFSPPYPNSFDYTDVYNVELWSMGYLSSGADNKRLRDATLRSHVQILRDFGCGSVQSAALERTMKALLEVRERLWNRHIPEMIGAYAGDLAVVMAQLARGLRIGGRAYVVVGDSRYAGVDVPVAEILIEVAEPIGYRLVKAEESRSMRASPQQGGRPELGETLVVLEREPR
ncbi:MAG: site-specific DNA-methyltransferase [Gammaproteobacteria bacterium]|nr:site-specific DNA-methyltransferase [Gammaproteobacteria bacterium]